MGALIQDLRYGIRMLVKNSGFTAVAVLTLALGIGANTAIFTVVNAVLVRPLPYKDAAKLVLVWQTEPELDRAPVTTDDFFAWKEQANVFDSMAAGTEGLSRASLTGPGAAAEAVGSAPVSAGLLEMLGVEPSLGRLMRPDEDVAGHDAVAVLSYGLWQGRFGSDPGVIGKTLTLDGKSRAIIGVMPKDFVFPRVWGIKPDLWVPLAPRRADAPSGHWLYVMARLKPGVTFQQAQTAIKAIAERRAKHEHDSLGVGAQLQLLRDYLVGSFRPKILVLFGVVSFVLLIACANVANLQLARATARERELAVRRALGAGRGRLLGQLFTENVLLAVLGGAAGLLAALWAKALLLSLSPPDYFPRASEINISPGVLAFTLGITFLSGVLLGLFPAFRGARADLNVSLKEGTRSLSDSPRSRQTRGAVVVAEISLAFALLVGAGLMIRSLEKLFEVNLGFETTNLVTMEVDLPDFSYTRPEQVLAFYHRALGGIQSLPRVKAAAFTSQLPLGGGPNSTIEVEGAPQIPGFGQGPLVQPTSVTLDYFRVLGVPLLKGRTFTSADTPKSAPVVVINAALAKQFWRGVDPVGKRLKFSGDSTWLEVVGVVGDSRRWSLLEEPMPEAYFTDVQIPDSHMKLVVRTASERQGGLANAIRSQISAVDINVPVYAITTMRDAVSESTAGQRFLTVLMSVFALVALILVVTGIYGVISYSVARETRNIGIRMALGARRVDILRMVLGKVGGLAILGVGIGLAVATGLTRFLADMLYVVNPMDTATFLGMAVLLPALALMACYLPARRATKVDPLVALRYE